MWRRWKQWLLWLADPVYRRWVEQKAHGPNARVKAGEQVVAVLTRANGQQIRRRNRR